MKKTTFELIYEIVKQIPEGKVATYGQIASLAGNKRWSRVVGYAMSACPASENVPCHRVVNRNGETAKIFINQAKLLEAEGIQLEDGKVDLKKYRWNRVTIEMME